MAHFAQIDKNNLVTQVIGVHNNELLDENGVEQESLGVEFCIAHLGGRWVQTSYNRNFRKNFASMGYFYDEKLDAFLPPKNYPSWILDKEIWGWVPPISYPTDGKKYNWNEETENWQLEG
jgi:hypothetical protein